MNWNNGKIFDKFEVEDVFTEYIHSLMQKGKEMLVFPWQEELYLPVQILVDSEIDEWIELHGIMDDTERLNYHIIRGAGGAVVGYAIRYTESITDLIVPYPMIQKSYDEFIAQAKNDLNNKR